MLVSVQIKSIIKTDYRVVRSGWRYLAWGRTTLVAIPNKNLPFVDGVLKLVEVECNQIIEKETLDLSSKYVEFGTQNVQRVTVSSGRPCAGRDSAGPLSGSWEMLEFLNPCARIKQNTYKYSGDIVCHPKHHSHRPWYLHQTR